MRQLLTHARVGRRLYPRGGFDGLEPAEIQVVVGLWQQPNATVGGLAQLLALNHSSVSNALRHLREGRLVGEGRALDRGRRPQLLTAEGAREARAFLAEASAVLQAEEHGSSALGRRDRPGLVSV